MRQPKDLQGEEGCVTGMESFLNFAYFFTRTIEGQDFP